MNQSAAVKKAQRERDKADARIQQVLDQIMPAETPERPVQVCWVCNSTFTGKDHRHTPAEVNRSYYLRDKRRRFNATYPTLTVDIGTGKPL